MQHLLAGPGTDFESRCRVELPFLTVPQQVAIDSGSNMSRTARQPAPSSASSGPH